MKFLIIDDESIVRKSIRRALEIRGHQVLEAAEGRAGLALWSSEKPDLVILDVLMPELSGFEVLQMRPAEDKAKVVLISAFTGSESPQDLLHAGAVLFLAKPFANIFEVAEKLEALIEDKGQVP